ncbi:MAG TPA: hypothetical protein VHO90_07430 [Bacteroidales bacterium]|nr:hypothetical protein [Bacteroidales bacterium]
MLDFLERHKEGILGTIIIHLALATVILIMKISSLQNRESAVALDMLSEEQVQQLLDPQENKEQSVQQPKQLFSPAEREYLNARNIGTNEAEQKASQNIDQMVNDIKNELNIKDPSPSQNKTTPQQSTSEDALPDNSKKEEAVNVSRKNTGIRTFYKGPTTVSYFLEGRYHENLPIPVYKCQGNGKVVMQIEVNHQGYVVKIEVDRTKSDIPEDCILETAEKAAKTTRFNSVNSGAPTQKGTLTYIFIAQ